MTQPSHRPAPQSPRDIVMADALELSQWIRLRKVSCREVMSAFLDHIERVNTPANAIVSLRPRDLLLREAGGTMSDFSGTPGSIWNGEVVAGNEAVQGQLLKVIKSVK